MKKVAILGTGPAGLMAAHACKLAGVPFHLFGLGNRSPLGGAQFLHKPVPHLNNEEPDFTITYRLEGSPDEYRRKVYGTTEAVPFVSMSNVTDGEQVPAWSLERTYELLWRDIAGDGQSINVMQVTPEKLIAWLESGTFDLVVSTIPKKALCLSEHGLVNDKHHFWSQRIQIMNRCIRETLEPNTIVYNGTPDVSWYRTSFINGIGSTEWGGAMIDKWMPYKTVDAVKPVSTNCTCFSNFPVVFTGRYGAWRKGLLAHDAMIDTWKALEA